jgi:hypothetical protein
MLYIRQGLRKITESAMKPLFIDFRQVSESVRIAT